MNGYRSDTHSKVMGYLMWIFGFLGAHRFYYGKPVTGTIWFFTFGLFGLHRMYQGKWITGVIYLLTGGLFLVGILYDFWTLNDQISMKNARRG
ncbi:MULTISPECIES: NINE protein [Pseudomonas syringae group]|uniref:NINE protein n=1 Tax=Pseudomonas syringae group TaxID=136849 RepID=UPI000EFF64F5|nr:MULTISPECIES: TM2 domain-containing protein [Pseudomonas syringae group]MCF5744042.1 NINE protein [Pseudomonas tremae]RMP27917.1 hypothetical protein ALQ25_02531 [Pseudomonas coronafaciens pv. atropurpurea]UQB36129.1 TM2 domain-containing protein [Pseudomonas tremae]